MIFIKPKISQRCRAFIERCDKEEKEKGAFIYVPETDAQEVVMCLTDIFLGEDWYYDGGMATTNGQMNTIILDRILLNYSKDYLKRDK